MAINRFIFKAFFACFKKALLIVFIVSFCFSGLSQTKKIDLLKISLAKSKTDTSKATIFNTLAMETRYISADTSLFYANKGLLLSKKNNFLIGEVESYLWICVAKFNTGKNDTALLVCIKALQISDICIKSGTKELLRLEKVIARLYNMLGNIYKHYGNYDLSLKKFEDCLKIRLLIDDKEGIAVTLSNIALIYSLEGNYIEALKKNFASLKVSASDKNNNGISQTSVYNAIGKIYLEEGNSEQAINYFLKSLDMSKKSNHNGNIAGNLMSIGLIYAKKKNYNTALYYYSQALDISSKNKLKNIQAMSLLNIAKIYNIQRNNKEALVYAKKSLTTANESMDKFMISENLNFIGTLFSEIGKTKEAIEYCEKSLELATSLKSSTQIYASSLSLMNSYKKAGNIDKAYEMQKLCYSSSDSVLAQKNKQEIMKQELKYQYEKQTLADSLNYNNQKKNIENINQIKLQTEKNKQFYLIIGLVLVIIFSVFLYKRFKISKQQNLIIERQKVNLETKTKQINDSILYSKEIQNAFLKPFSYSEKYYKDAQLIYKPKDIVSGDFYWHKEIDNKLYVVVGDCTGHGVPGAIISVLAIQSLEKTIYKIKDNHNLHELSMYLKEEFSAYYSDNKQVSIGLDYSIICLNIKEQKVYISGSGSNILIKDKEQKLHVDKFDSINIGGSSSAIYNPKTSIYDIGLLESVYLYTDGLIDQKGSETKKKFSTKKLKELVLSLNTNEILVIVDKIEKEVVNWMGETEQIDDITLLGIQINQG